MLTTIVILFPSVLALCAIVKTMTLIRENQKLSARLHHLSKQLLTEDQENRAVKPQQVNSADFSTTLSKAHLSTGLARPRLASQQLCRPHGPSPLGEKYGFIASLAKKGMASADISKTLSVSIHEVKQVLSLCRLVKPKPEI
jgi:hypothetical protein